MYVGEVVTTYKRKKVVRMPNIKSSNDVSHFFRRLISPDVLEHHEEFWVAFLNRANEIIGYKLVSVGALTATIVDVRHILQSALGCNCSAMILMHNHPSGNLAPSSADDNLTERIKQASKLFDIDVVDHIILTHDYYYSYADEGKL